MIVKHSLAIWGYDMLYSKVEFIEPISMPENRAVILDPRPYHHHHSQQ